MLWFFLEALVALLIAVAIVGWTMGFGRRKPRNKPGDADPTAAPRLCSRPLGLCSVANAERAERRA
jgi:hypothetical protein